MLEHIQLDVTNVKFRDKGERHSRTSSSDDAPRDIIPIASQVTCV